MFTEIICVFLFDAIGQRCLFYLISLMVCVCMHLFIFLFVVYTPNRQPRTTTTV